MNKSAGEVIKHINSAQNGVLAYENAKNKVTAIFIKSWVVKDNVIEVDISQKIYDEIKNIDNKKFAISIWEKMKGYQIKGTLKDADEKKLCITFEKIYNVSPGNHAGELVELQFN